MNTQKRIAQSLKRAAKIINGMRAPDVTSDFALLDIKKGRTRLASRVDKGDDFDVVIRGTITSVWGGNDGISQEFQVDVKSLVIGPGRKVREPRKHTTLMVKERLVKGTKVLVGDIVEV